MRPSRGAVFGVYSLLVVEADLLREQQGRDDDRRLGADDNVFARLVDQCNSRKWPSTSTGSGARALGVSALSVPGHVTAPRLGGERSGEQPERGVRAAEAADTQGAADGVQALRPRGMDRSMSAVRMSAGSP